MHNKMQFQHFYFMLTVICGYTHESRIAIDEFKEQEDVNHRLMQQEVMGVEEDFNKALYQGLNARKAKYFQPRPDFKQYLNNFQMKRKLTHFHIPSEINLNRVTFLPAKLSPNKVTVLENKIKRSDLKQKNLHAASKPIKNRKIEKHGKENAENYFFENPKVMRVLNNQMELMLEMLQLMEDQKLTKIKRSYSTDFDAILESMERREQNKTENNDIERITEKGVIIENRIDETVIKEKLKNDPLVQRIIAMAKLKRKEYFEKLSTLTTKGE